MPVVWAPGVGPLLHLQQQGQVSGPPDTAQAGVGPLLYLYLLARGTADTPAILSPNTSGTFQNGTSLKQFQTGDRKRSCNVRHFLLLLLVEQHQAPVRPI